ncbi:Hypothetical predicted protein [Cloeon dipterum]|uniref:C-type lectin domain-containing protein n=1 Tax=Cloeon dipterum TaxID=197152 RepID=A0A8S1DM60_9INSE|nr:Hypothetical predicted protein [Cloeon dipterum]
MNIDEQNNHKSFFMWTSGMAEGKSCGNAAYSWCAGDRKRINASAFGLSKEISAVSQRQRCLALSTATRTLVRSDCSNRNYFFCEYKCKTVPCLTKCALNMTYFDASGKMINRSMMDEVWAQWEQKSGIQITFIFGNKKVTNLKCSYCQEDS